MPLLLCDQVKGSPRYEQAVAAHGKNLPAVPLSQAVASMLNTCWALASQRKTKIKLAGELGSRKRFRTKPASSSAKR